MIGAGAVVEHRHLPALPLTGRAEARAIFDPDRARAEQLAGQFQIARVASSLSEAVSSDDIDAVVIASPNSFHREGVERAVEAGKHVFCEKPMATTLEDAQRIHEAAAASGKVFQVGHNRRFAPVYKNVKKLLEASPSHCAHIKMNRGELLNPVWVGDAAVTGGFLFETPIHMFDMMRFLLGEIVSVQARESRKDDFSMLVEFEGGQHATFVTSADTSWFFPYESVEVYGEYSTIRTEEMEKLEWRIGLDKPTSVENFANLTREEKWGFAEEDRLFVDAILGDGKPPVTSYDGLKSVEMTMAVYQSAKEKTAVRLEL